MAVIVRTHEMSEPNIARLPQPIIYCQSNFIDDKAVSLNIPLSVILAAIKPNRRTIRLEQCFRQVLDGLPVNPLIRDFDVLFNPDYEVDILQIMASIGKSKPYQVIWPGRYEKDRLVYAEEGYMDYKVFNLEKYDVTCVI